MERQTALSVGKIIALATLIIFVLAPLAGCQNVTISGYQLLFDQELVREAPDITLFAWLVVVASIAAVLVSRIVYFFPAGALGLLSLALLFLRIKYGGNRVTEEFIEIKIGGILTAIGHFSLMVLPALFPETLRREPRVIPKREEVEVREEPQPASEVEEALSSQPLSSFIGSLRKGLESESLKSLLPQPTTDRLLVFFGSLLICLIMAVNLLVHIGNFANLSGEKGFWLGVQLPLCLYGFRWLWRAHSRGEYPFDKPRE